MVLIRADGRIPLNVTPSTHNEDLSHQRGRRQKTGCFVRGRSRTISFHDRIFNKKMSLPTHFVQICQMLSAWRIIIILSYPLVRYQHHNVTIAFNVEKSILDTPFWVNSTLSAYVCLSVSVKYSSYDLYHW